VLWGNEECLDNAQIYDSDDVSLEWKFKTLLFSFSSSVVFEFPNVDWKSLGWRNLDFGVSLASGRLQS
jgi:hypothetical protein